MRTGQCVASIGCVVLLAFRICVCQVTVDGHVYLENRSVHDSVRVIIERTIPDAAWDTAFSDNTGYFQAQVDGGIYRITYQKSGYVDLTTSDTPIYANTTLPDTTLQMLGLSGSLSGVIDKGEYKIGGDIYLDSTDTLVLQPGVRFGFGSGVGFTVNGLLIAVGTDEDSIRFERYGQAEPWTGITIEDADTSTRLSHCVIDGADDCGLKILNTSLCLHRSAVRNNTARAVLGGGGVYVDGGAPELVFVNIEDNTSAYDWGGGGIRVRGNSAARLVNCRIRRNRAVSGRNKGGGLFHSGDGSLYLENVEISNNSTGGIFFDVDQSGLLVIKGGTIVNNVSNAGLGVGLEISEPSITDVHLSNTVISGNRVGISSTHTPTIKVLDIRYCNIWGNGTQVSNIDKQWLLTNVSTNANGDSCDGWSNVSVDPVFQDTSSHDFRLQSTSPMIDVGLDDSASSVLDLDGNQRIWDGDGNGSRKVDIGAYEFGAMPVSVVHEGGDRGATRGGGAIRTGVRVGPEQTMITLQGRRLTRMRVLAAHGAALQRTATGGATVRLHLCKR